MSDRIGLQAREQCRHTSYICVYSLYILARGHEYERVGAYLRVSGEEAASVEHMSENWHIMWVKVIFTLPG